MSDQNPSETCLQQLFEQQVARVPDSLAVSMAGRSPQQLSYRQLNERANQLAHHLTGKGVGPGIPVGIFLRRGVEMVVAVLAVLKAGGAYVPLDPTYPAKRLGFMVADSGTRFIVTQTDLEEELPSTEVQLICVDSAPAESLGNLSFSRDSRQPAYIIYTSGTTGQPKGIVVPHGAVLNLLHSLQERPGFSERDTLLSVISLSFDLFVLDLHLPLSVGGTLVLADEASVVDGHRLSRLLAEHEITFMQATPATWRLLVDSGWSGELGLKALSGGDVVSEQLRLDMLSRCGEFWNGFGPAETTVHSLLHQIRPEDARVFVGRPIANTQVYILDSAGQPVPAGVAGELYIAGEGLALGYLGREGLTTERFLENPFAEGRMYRTGDLARFSGDGLVESLGRTDHQVKIRGFRIELGGIETVLLKHPEVLEAVVVPHEGQAEQKRLTACLVTRSFSQRLGNAQVHRWREVWDGTYRRQPSSSKSQAGLVSSYTQQPLPEKEVKEWLETTLAHLRALKATRVWEIGCGSGLLLEGLAPECEDFLGTDFSQLALDECRGLRDKLDLNHIELRRRQADDFTDIEPGRFDCVVLNSVVQYFPSVEYLVTVLRGAVRSVRTGGAIYLGDVRNFHLLPAYQCALHLSNSSPDGSVAQLQAAVTKGVQEEEEFLVAPEFFKLLPSVFSEIERVEIQLHRGLAHNELTQFRYHVTLHLAGASEPEKQGPRSWSRVVLADWTLAALEESLQLGRLPQDKVGWFFSGIPNPRVARYVRAAELLHAPDLTLNSVGQLREHLVCEASLEPEEVAQLGERLGYLVCLTWSDSLGEFDALFTRPEEKDRIDFSTATDQQELSSFANRPLSGQQDSALVAELRASLAEQLPDYMMPAAFEFLESLPLTPNRKVDRSALIRHCSELYAGGIRKSMVALEEVATGDLRGWLLEAIEVEVVGLLGSRPVPPDRPLKELGLHSLMAVGFSLRLGERIGLALPATLVFDYPEPAAIAGFLLTLLQDRGEEIRAPLLGPVLDEPVAIIGVGCRVPGGFHGPGNYWSLLDRGGDAVGPAPGRLGHQADELPEGGYLEYVDRFDAGFFGISPIEALRMEPQQRLVLEVGWEALEGAGVLPDCLRDSSAGVYLGAIGSDYRAGDDGEDSEPYHFTGRTSSVLSGRLAYLLDLHGPAITVDTACSASLVATHLACNGLRLGECDLALAGGVQVMSGPALVKEFGRLGGLADNGRCKAFSATADGTSLSEGAGILVLKRLSDAQRDSDRVLAVIRGTAVNQDGRSQGLTAPNGPSQQRVIQRALALSRLQPHDIDVVEAHGTGTRLGDPIEAGALSAVFAGREQPLWLGSSKSNIGHAQAAAGVLGVIKMVLALQHECLPKTLHAQNPSSHIEWENSGLALLQEEQPWPRVEGHIRRAGVSAFGISGTNAHLVLEEAPEVPVQTGQLQSPEVLPLLLSGKTVEALQANASRLLESLGSRDVSHLDLAYSLATTRTAFPIRFAFPVKASDAEAGYPALAEALASVTATERRPGKLGVLFSGQGSQRQGMGSGLYGQPGLEVFTKTYDAAMRACEVHLGESLKEVLESGEGLQSTRLTQPALFVLETALFRQWQKWGLEADVLLGHSIGELIAAHVGGVLSLEDAACLVCARGRLMEELATPDGAMASVQASEEEVLEAIKSLPDSLRQVEVAALNSAGQTTVSGERAAVNALTEQFAKQGRRTKDLEVSHAFHSRHMDSVLEAFTEVASGLTYRRSEIPLISNVTGEVLEEIDAQYWVKQMRETVRFAKGVERAQEMGVATFLECGPGAALSVLVEEGVASMGGHELSGVMGALGTLYERGHELDWESVFEGMGAKRVDLPTYAFQRQSYWLEPARSVGPRDLGLEAVEHPLIRTASELPDGNWLLSGEIHLEKQPWLADHVVQGTVIVPGTAILELCWQAARTVGAQRISELLLLAPMSVNKDNPVRQLQVYLHKEDDGYEIQIRSKGEQDWSLHATAEVTMESCPEIPPLLTWPPAGAEKLALELPDFYESLSDLGISLGPAFRGLQGAWQETTGEGTVWLEVRLPEGVARSTFLLHPALSDSVLGGLSLLAPNPRTEVDLALPFRWSGVSLRQAGCSVLRARLQDLGRLESDIAQSVTITLWDGHGQPVAHMEDFRTQPMTAEQIQSAGRVDSRPRLYRWQTRPIAIPEESKVPQAWADLSTCELKGERVVLDLRGHQCTPEELCTTLLMRLQDWTAQERLESLTVITGGSQPQDFGRPLEDIAGAAAWGLLRTLGSERPELVIRLLDTDDHHDSETVLKRAAEGSEALEAVIRHGRLLGLSLKEFEEGALECPSSGPFRLAKSNKGNLDELNFQSTPELERDLSSGEVRVDVRATGLNFYDLMVALDMYPGEAGWLGGEASGIVREVAEDVTDLRVGERVMGLMRGSFGPEVIIEAKLLAPIPKGLSFAQAATVPIAFLTAYYGLVDLAKLRPGESLLIHAVSGGVGMAALQLGRYLGAEVFGTASLGKWSRLDLEPSRLSNSRDLSFESDILERTNGRGVDVVLNSLKGEFVDASLRVLGEGGRFLEMGKTDIRKGVENYTAFDLGDAAPTRVQEMLVELCALFKQGVLCPLPLFAQDLRLARDSFRFMAQAKHVGKLALVTPPPALKDSLAVQNGTVLITGGTGALGRVTAEHLVRHHGARNVLLVSRSGEGAEGAEELRRQLKSVDSAVRVAVKACDVADQEALAKIINEIPKECPLTGIFHLAGVLRDATFTQQTPAALREVFRSKLKGGLHLHELTKGLDTVSHFVLFSSIAGLLGSAGQANYAAANAGLDALAARRRGLGLPALSIAWGPWDEVGLAAALSARERGRMARKEGLLYSSVEEALEMLDAALAADAEVVAAVSLTRAEVQQAPHSGPAPLTRLNSMTSAQKQAWMLDFVRSEVAEVLGFVDLDGVPISGAIQDLGLDSLMAVELRNALASKLDLKLPLTLVFDYPEPRALADFLCDQTLPLTSQSSWTDREIEDKLRRVDLQALRESGLLEGLMLQPDAPLPANEEGQVDVDELDKPRLLVLWRELLGDESARPGEVPPS